MASPRMRRAAAGSLVLVIAAVPVACGGDDGAASSAGSETSTSAEGTTGPTEAAPPGALASAEMPYEAGVLEVTDEGVWVFPHLDPVAVRIDPEDMAIDLEVPLPSRVSESVYGDGMLWVWTEQDESSFTRIDPATGEVLARIPDVDVGDPSIAFGSVWLPGSDGHVTRVDPESNGTERIQLQSGGTFLLAATTDRLWALGADGLVGYDPASGERTEPWRPLSVIGDIPTMMDSSGGDTLLFATAGRISEVDPLGQQLLGSVDAPEGMTPLYAVNRFNGRDEPPTWIFAPVGQESPERGAPVPTVVVARLGLDPLQVAASMETAFPEGHVRRGDDLWTTPIRGHLVVRSAAP